ncbi:MAG TPA: hypothetical protein VFU21_20125 [Kofleriaceae bacterium]|nr:hypothetical protein [Kofleriaceae bacterium]
MRFASGFATGMVALVCAEVIAWGVVVAAPYRDAYREFHAQLPAITRVALSPSWIFGLVAVLALAAAGLNVSARLSETARARVLAALAVLAVALAVGTAWAGVYPFTRLAGTISAG